MTFIALLLLTVALADIARERFRRPVASLVGIAVAVATAVVTSWSLGVGILWALVVAAIAVAWIAATATTRPGQIGYLALGILIVPLAVGWAWTPFADTPDSPVGRWYETLPYGFVGTVDVTTFVLAVAGILALIETANIVVRTIIAAAPRLPASTLMPAAAEPNVSIRRALFGRQRRGPNTDAPASATSSGRTLTPAEPPLKGGRIIGPFERVFLIALVLAGEFTAIAALVAAKGVIRFPEISRDDPHGAKAEYFLVGSFASWATVGVIAVLIASAQ